MKPKLHCTSLFTTWEFPERALLSNSFPIHGYVHNPEVLWVFKTPHSPKCHTSPKLQQYGLVQLQSGLLLDFLSLTTGSSPVLTTNKEALVGEGLSWVQVAGGRKREGPSGPSESGFPLATKIECKCQQMLTTRICAARTGGSFPLLASFICNLSDSQGLSLVMLCKQLLYTPKVNFTNTLQCVAGGAINHEPISNFVMPYLIRTRSIFSPDIHVFKHEDQQQEHVS